jgi:hypothetical protein
MNQQLDFWPKTREEYIEEEIIKLRKDSDKMRKSQYAKISELRKLCNETKYELETLKSALCRDDLFMWRK